MLAIYVFPCLLALAMTLTFVHGTERLDAVLDRVFSPDQVFSRHLVVICISLAAGACCLVFMGLLEILFVECLFLFTECAVTGRRVVCRSITIGGCYHIVHQIPLSALRAVKIQQKRWEKVFDCGTVTLLGDAGSVRNQYGWISPFGRVKMRESSNVKAIVPLKYVSAPFALKTFIEEREPCKISAIKFNNFYEITGK